MYHLDKHTCAHTHTLNSRVIHAGAHTRACLCKCIYMHTLMMAGMSKHICYVFEETDVARMDWEDKTHKHKIITFPVDMLFLPGCACGKVCVFMRVLSQFM